MDFNEYQRAAMKTAIYPETSQVLYPTLLLASEAGEVAGKIQKLVRSGKDLSLLKYDDKAAIVGELGDCLWSIAALASDLGVNLQNIASGNIEKLASRKARNVLEGNGDNR